MTIRTLSLRLCTALIGALALASCVGGGTPRGFEISRANDETEQEFRARRAAAIEDRLVLARAALDADDLDGCRQITAELLRAEDVPPSSIIEARRLEFTALRSELEHRILQTEVRFASSDIAQGEPIEVALILGNRSQEPLSVLREGYAAGTKGWDPTVTLPEARGPAAARTRIHIEVRHIEHPIDGTIVEGSYSRVMNVEQNINVPPGGEHVFRFQLDSMEFGGRTSLRSFEVSARLWPAELLVGERNYPGAIDFKPSSCYVFPLGYEHLKDSPSERLHQAVIVKASAVHVPLVAALIPADERDAAVEWLLKLLARSPEQPPTLEVRMAMGVALRILTGVRRGPGVEDWLAWSRER